MPAEKIRSRQLTLDLLRGKKENMTKSQGVTKPGSLEWVPSVHLEVGLVWD